MALIDPLLRALGWDVFDPEVVTPEYKVEGGWADYALLRADGRPAATVEAKKLGEVLGSHRMRLLNYANASGISITGTPLFVNVHLSAYGVRQNTKRLLKRCGLNPADVHLHVAQSPKDLLPTDRQTTIPPGNDNAGKVRIRTSFWNLPSRL
jgi:hypothetical protein